MPNAVHASEIHIRFPKHVFRAKKSYVLWALFSNGRSLLNWPGRQRHPNLFSEDHAMPTGFMWMLIVCGTIQAALLVALIVYLWLLFATRHWLPADGTIVTSRVDSRGTDSVNGSDTEIARTPLVEYDYQVNGQPFRGDRIMIGGSK